MTIIFRIFFVVIMIFASLVSASFSAEETCFMMGTDKPCDLQINGSSYHIETKGDLLVKHSGKVSSIKINLPECFYIERVTYQIYENKILFTFGITDDDSGSAIIAQFDPTYYRLLWATEINAFNISPLLISGNNIYVGGIGMVAKLKLSNGKIVWQHRDLYVSGSGIYNSFKVPKKEDKAVIFQDERSEKEVRVDDATGKILSK
jgi:outer membrane protein assembly factor BamB